jgi:LPXTG-motif cell wall-anchored protein
MEKLLEWLGQKTGLYKGDAPVPNIVVVGLVIFLLVFYILKFFKKK